MEDAVFCLVREHKSLELGIGSMDKFKRALKEFDKQLNLAQDADIAYIVDMHYEVLSKVKLFIKEKHMGNAHFKRLHDDVFVMRLGMPRNKMPSTVTMLFQEFIKGITYFKHQLDPSNPVPIYHRFFSCGVGNDIYRGNNLICTHNLSTVEKKRRRLLIERCYLERLIYDALFVHETLHFPLVLNNVEHSQDKGHMFRMDLTRQDYETCFKGHGIDVSVQYQGRFPVILTITRKKNGVILFVEEFKQELRADMSVIAPYTGIVVCKRTLANGKVYMKTQGFTMEGDWRAVP